MLQVGFKTKQKTQLNQQDWKQSDIPTLWEWKIGENLNLNEYSLMGWSESLILLKIQSYMTFTPPPSANIHLN